MVVSDASAHVLAGAGGSGSIVKEQAQPGAYFRPYFKCITAVLRPYQQPIRALCTIRAQYSNLACDRPQQRPISANFCV